MIDVAEFAPVRVSVNVAGDTSSNNALERTAEVCNLQIKSDWVAAQLNIVTSERGTRRSLARVRGDGIINLRASLDTSRDVLKLH